MSRHYITNGKHIEWYFSKDARDAFLAKHPEWRMVTALECKRMSVKRHKPSAYESRVVK